MSLKDLKRLTILQVVAIVLLAIACAQAIDKQNQQIRELQEQIKDNRDSIRVQADTNKRQDVMINKHNQMYYEFQHWKTTGETDFPGG
ncbi:hypothetical protein D8798_00855 [Streptococcus cristatus]|uniref:Phage protein n=1 Tax=Streptococcus cristatus TaxID=45634 RepID=A0A428GJM6_STRCR|nr:hypothetical protein [Streptococcus cristatus]RSJ77708.1 hypothetical protein D8798_00855 [Streptococcus cristatus]